jgi:hypothetical protein
VGGLTARAYPVLLGNMTTKIKFLVALILVVGAVGAYLFVSYPLPRFARRIASADRVVASMKRGTESIAIIGEDAKRLVQVVFSAKRQRPAWPWEMQRANIYDVRITFYEGTRELGDILSCTSFFKVGGKKYRYDTGLLGTLAVHPVHNAYVEQGGRQMESK